MKYFLLLCFLVVGCGVKAQTYYVNKVTIKVLDEAVTINKEYEIKRDGKWIYFNMALFNGSQGWAFQIVDSTKGKTYVLDYHWITTFDSLQIRENYIRLFNRTHDEIYYHFY